MNTKTNVLNCFGMVIHVINYRSNCDVIINKGEKDGISANDRFLIYEIGEELFDTDNGENLGRLEIVKGIAKPKNIQNNRTILVSAEFKYDYTQELIPLIGIKVGDLVKPLKRKI